MNTEKLNPDQKAIRGMGRTITRCKKQIKDLQVSRDYWQKRALLAEKQINK